MASGEAESIIAYAVKMALQESPGEVEALVLELMRENARLSGENAMIKARAAALNLEELRYGWS
jgi:hypothetical protein